MGDPLVLRQVTVARAPGFDRDRLPVLTGFQPGLNVVWGPNGVGKSTLARALMALLWRSPEDRLEAVALAEAAGRSWRLERRGRSLQQTLAGASAGGPEPLATPFTGLAEGDRYGFPLQELLDRNNTGAAFQAEILNEMQGGVDLDRACAEAGGDPRPLAPQSAPWAAFTRAVKARQQLSAEHAQQRWIRDQIARAEAALAQAQAAGQALAANRRLRDRLTAQARLQAAEEALERFPPLVTRLAAEDPVRLAELEGRRTALEKERQGIQEQLQERLGQLGALGVAEALRTDGAAKKRLQEARERLQGLGPEVQRAEAAVAEAGAGERAWRDGYRWLLPEPPEPARLQGMLARLRGLAQACEPLRCTLEVAGRRVAALGVRESGPAQDAPQVWMELQETLKAWQRQTLLASAPAPAPGIPRRRVLQAIAGTAILVLAAASLALAVWPPLALVSLPAPLLLVWLLRPQGGGEAPPVGAARSAALDLQAQAERLLAPFPELGAGPWTAAAVLELQAQVATRLGRAELRALGDGDRMRAGQDLEQARAAYGAWLEQWGAAATALGLRPGEPALQGAPFFHFAQGLWEWGQRLEALAVAQAGLEGTRDQQRQAEAALDRLLAELGAGAGAGAAPEDRCAQVQDLLERRDAAVLLAEQVRTLEDQRDRKGAELRQAGGALGRFWLERGFPAPDRPGLEALAAQVEPRKDALREHRLALAALEDQADPALAAAAAATSLAALDAADAGLRAEAAQQPERAQHLLDLKVKYEGLVQAGALALAMDAEGRARAALEEAQRRTTLNQVVHLLAKELQDSALAADQPRVLRGASARLRQFTAGRFELGLKPGQGFQARDTVGNRILELDELSSGTRVQLLFAVRLAFIEVKEGDGLKLPLFLDEVLANSDDERARAMVAALLEIARERQVFYFTAQTDEVAKLQGAAPAGTVAVFPLHQQGREQEQSRSPLRAIPLESFAPPEPLADYRAYGLACGAADARCFDPVESLHAWHLFRRSEELHFFLLRGGQRVGQILASTLAEAAAPRRRVEWLRRAQLLAQVGRGRPFHLQDLVAAKLAGVNLGAEYGSGIREAAESAGGDAGAFLRALAGVTRAGRAKAIIEAWLLEQGYLSEQAALANGEILLALFASYPDLAPGSEDHQVVERYLRAIAPEPADG